jgi:sugar lactone lactonase YvrE
MVRCNAFLVDQSVCSFCEYRCCCGCAGVLTVLAGSGSASFINGQGTAATFNNPNGLAITTDGTLYVADTYNWAIRQISSTGFVTTLAGSNTDNSLIDGPLTVARFSNPNGVAVDTSGTVFVVDTSHHAIRMISTSAGLVTTIAGSSQGLTNGFGTSTQFHNPGYIAVATNGKIYVADSSNNVIRVVNNAGDVFFSFL